MLYCEHHLPVSKTVPFYCLAALESIHPCLESFESYEVADIMQNLAGPGYCSAA